MISVDEALERVLAAAEARGVLPPEKVALGSAVGRILRETVRAGCDMPPFTRSAMDGYALRSADVKKAPCTLEVIEQIPAGHQPLLAVGPGQASKIMTGGVVPEGADAVQMIEETEGSSRNTVRILSPVEAGRHVRKAGEEIRKGEVLLEEGSILEASRIALLASEGRAEVTVFRRPRVAIIPTGDELVSVDRKPGPAQIRESNGHCLSALVQRDGGLPEIVDIARDNRDDLGAKISGALSRADLLLLSGGVSVGDFDFVGSTLVDLGCRTIFEKVAIQPGKPLFFAVGRDGGKPLVFGLPGNPVSTFVDFLVFARPALRRIGGSRSWGDVTLTARLEKPLQRRAGRRGYLPAVLTEQDGRLTVGLVPSRGSADMVAVSRANALAIIPEEADRLEAGASVQVLPVTFPAGA